MPEAFTSVPKRHIATLHGKVAHIAKWIQNDGNALTFCMRALSPDGYVQASEARPECQECGRIYRALCQDLSSDMEQGKIRVYVRRLNRVSKGWLYTWLQWESIPAAVYFMELACALTLECTSMSSSRGLLMIHGERYTLEEIRQSLHLFSEIVGLPQFTLIEDYDTDANTDWETGERTDHLAWKY